jgi:transcriptional regulator with XRE-family HTH domain
MNNRVRDERVAQLLTQKDLAVKAGIDPSHLCRIETGVFRPRLITQEKIARALGVPRQQLFPQHKGEER